MKLSRIIAVGAATALVGVSTLAIGGSASAAESYVTDIQTSPSWTITGTGTATDSAAGLVLDGTAGAVAIETVVSGTDLDIFESGLWGVLGGAFFQIHIDPDAGSVAFAPTILTADASGDAQLSDPLATWTTSAAFGSLAAGSSNTIAIYMNEIGGIASDISFLGVMVPMGSTATVINVESAPDVTWFLPAAPALAVTPASVTVDGFSDTGVTFTVTGYAAGEDVVFAVNAPSFTDILSPIVADSTGAVTFTYVGPADSTIGNYDVFATGDTSGIQLASSFALTANVLPVTGADFTPAVITGSLLLLVGAGFMVIARRRAAHND